MWGSSSDPSINGHLHYPNDIDRPLNETATDKIRKYHVDYNNNPPNVISFMTTIASTSGRLHSEFVCLLFLQAHRETDRFFADSGVHLTQSTSDQFHFKRVWRSPHNLNRKSVTFSPCSTADNIEYWWRTCDVQITHSPITLANLSFINLHHTDTHG